MLEILQRMNLPWKCCEELPTHLRSAISEIYWTSYTGHIQVINEDTSALTKTWANARLEGPDAVQTMLK